MLPGFTGFSLVELGGAATHLVVTWFLFLFLFLFLPSFLCCLLPSCYKSLYGVPPCCHVLPGSYRVLNDRPDSCSGGFINKKKYTQNFFFKWCFHIYSLLLSWSDPRWPLFFLVGFFFLFVFFSFILNNNIFIRS